MNKKNVVMKTEKEISEIFNKICVDLIGKPASNKRLNLLYKDYCAFFQGINNQVGYPDFEIRIHGYKDRSNKVHAIFSF